MTIKNTILLLLFISTITSSQSGTQAIKKWHLTLLKNLPEPITNNAVSEGFIKGKAYVYTFGGLDSTKRYSGIHRRSYRLDIANNTWQQIADVPDTLGKIAGAASRIKNTIYILGGYHVFANGTEKSSNKVHRYDIVNKIFLKDGTPIPIPIDDHVQGVWRDSLLYVITGWSNKANVPNVQIYNPQTNHWAVGTPVPNNHMYKSFGASGTIVDDTIFYLGGAAMGKFYPIQHILRKGVINKNNPTEIQWSHQVLDTSFVGYRMASTRVNNTPHWLGGSTVTYNYNAIAYNGSGGVTPSNRDVYLSKNEANITILNSLPMDVRGVAEVNDSVKILIGGIEKNQKVSNKVYRLEWKE
jgi:N-acetylneuraminic acid mutarotase